MPSMPSPPEGYDCTIKGFNNISDKGVVSNIPGALNQPKLTIADVRTDHSNTTRIPFASPVMPKGM